MPARKQGLLIGGLALSLYVAALGQAPLWDRDEPRNAGCAAEMMARNDWVVPVFNGELRTHKPVLLYWLMMASYGCLGVNEFSARLPSALLGTATVLLTYSIARRLSGESTARWSSLVLATSLLFTMSSRAATPDATLVFFSTLAVWACVRLGGQGEVVAGQGPASLVRLDGWSSLVVYGAMGMAVLAKGPVGVVLPAAVLTCFAWTKAGCPRSPSRLAEIVWALRPFRALIVVAMVAGPWYACVGWRTHGIWLWEFLGQHNVGRALQPMEGHNGSAFLYYPVSLLVGFFPWSVLAIPLGLDLYRKARASGKLVPLELLAFSWLAVYLLAFSLAQTKLPSYLLPAYPAVALLLGSFLDRCFAGRGQLGYHWLAVAAGSLVLCGLALTGGLAWAIPEYLYDDWTLLLMGWVPLLGGVMASLVCQCRMPRHSLAFLAGTAIVLNLVVFAWSTTRIGGHQECARLLAPIRAESQQPVAAFGSLEPSWVFYAGRPIRYFALEEAKDLIKFVTAHPAAFVITSADDRMRLPAGWDEVPPLDETTYFLRDERLQIVRFPVVLCRR